MARADTGGASIECHVMMRIEITWSPAILTPLEQPFSFWAGPCPLPVIPAGLPAGRQGSPESRHRDVNLNRSQDPKQASITPMATFLGGLNAALQGRTGKAYAKMRMTGR